MRDVDAMIREYQSGKSGDQLAREYNVSTIFVRNRLIAAGVKRTPKEAHRIAVTGARNDRLRSVGPTMLRAFAAGASVTAIARQCGMSTDVINSYLRDHSMRPRNHREAAAMMPKRGPVLSLDVECILSDYASGKPMSVLATERGISSATIRQRLCANGITLRRGSAARRRIALDAEELARKYLAGTSKNALARELKVGSVTIGLRLSERGIKIRGRREANTLSQPMRSASLRQRTVVARPAINCTGCGIAFVPRWRRPSDGRVFCNHACYSKSLLGAHGTCACYGRGCRCGLCSNANANARQASRARIESGTIGFTYTCPTCGGSAYRPSRSKYGRTFCGRACYTNAQVAIKQRSPCIWCGGPIKFGNTKGQQGSRPRRYCSDACYTFARVAFAGHTYDCSGCGKAIEREHRATQKNVFCTSRCFGKWITRTRRASGRRDKSGRLRSADDRLRPTICRRCNEVFMVKSGAWKSRRFCSEACRRPPVIVVCRTCKQSFRRGPSSTRIFCQFACYRRYHGENRLEADVRTALDALGHEYVQEMPVGRYSVDFALPARHVALEVDGTFWHRGADHSRRDAFITSHGWCVVRMSEVAIRARANDLPAFITESVAQTTA